MTGVARRRGSLGFAIFTLAMVVMCLSLGIWQLQRRVEKHALIAALDERLAAAPEMLPASAQWSGLTPAKDEFRRVHFTATYARLPDVMVYSSGSAIRSDVSGPGTWAFLPAQTADGAIVVVNTGFVQNTMQDRAQEDRAVGRLVTGQPVKLTGYLRFPEAAGTLTPAENTSKRAVVHARSPRHGARARLGRGRQDRCAFLCRSGIAGARQRHPEAGATESPSQGRPHANMPSPGSGWRVRW